MAKVEEARSFGLSAADIKALKGQRIVDKKFPNPYRNGVYRFSVDALVDLGINKRHPLAKVHAAFKQIAGDDWYGKWANKESRNAETGKDAEGRFLQNFKVLQRPDYGRKLLEVGRRILNSKGAVIDLVRDKHGDILVCLNTKCAKPTKLGRAPLPTKQ